MKDTSFIILILISLLAACNGTDTTRQRIHNDFENRHESFNKTDLFDIFDREMAPREREAMEFLYAYMPLSDLTNYTDSFYLENVRMSLKAREEMPWGKSVPEREFRHFVLPVRVNNENLDSSRVVFYNELKDRVAGLSMADAILEINHWCHEKVTYRPSDSRTSSPLASVRTAYGRCGEESTFTVAALRAMGIPARQVYTPRWAHTDDNHAWVEAWADGQWHFLGACEPEAILDLGWFNAPASRGMMMNTKVMGAYDGPEEVLSRSNCYTEINVTANYAPVSTATVRVVDTEGNPVAGASVEFKLYNYAEFYTLARKTTDADGIATLTTGLGDMLAWASDGNRFGFEKISVTQDGGTVTVSLNLDSQSTGTWEWDMTPPPANAQLPAPTTEEAKANSCRLAAEDSIRAAYTATFPDKNSATEVVAAMGYKGTDTDRAASLLTLSEGNHQVISTFLLNNVSDPRTLPLLESLSEKDLRDITVVMLADRMKVPVMDSPLYDRHILSPRVTNEMLSPYHTYFINTIPTQQRDGFRADPQRLIAWCRDSIDIDNDWNPQSIALNPESVHRYHISDRRSRDIFFVAIARSCGIPARIDPVTEHLQMADTDGIWNDVNLSGEQAESVTRITPGYLQLTREKAVRPQDPLYFAHFTISRIENGFPVLLNYPDFAPWSSTFAIPAELEPGQYLLTTGQRLADGTVLSHLDIFEIKADKTTVIPLEIRKDDTRVEVSGSFNSENIYHDAKTATDKSLLSSTGRGYYILGLLAPNHEPTVHALNDLSDYKDTFEQWGGAIVLLADSQEDADRLNIARFSDLPSTVITGTDISGNIRDEIISSLNLTSREYPVFIIADTFNRVVFISQGYNIGLGKQLTDTLHKIE